MTRSTEITTAAGPIKLTAKRERFVDTLAKVGDVPLASQAAGYAVRSGWRLWALPQVKALVRAKAQDLLALGASVAAQRVLELLRQDDSRKVALDAAELVLACQGIKPPQAPALPPLQIGVQVGYIVDWSEPAETIEAEERAGAKPALPQPGAI